jgi:hypothetical protein
MKKFKSLLGKMLLNAETMNLNQFEQAPIKGSLDLSMNSSGVISGKVSSNQATALYPGDRVALDTVAGSKVPSFVAVAANVAAIGVVVFSSKKSAPTYAAGDIIEVALFTGARPVMWCEALLAVSAQQAVQWAAGQTVTPGTTTQMGIAIDAGAAGALIRVILTREALS